MSRSIFALSNPVCDNVFKSQYIFYCASLSAFSCASWSYRRCYFIFCFVIFVFSFYRLMKIISVEVDRKVVTPKVKRRGKFSFTYSSSWSAQQEVKRVSDSLKRQLYVCFKTGVMNLRPARTFGMARIRIFVTLVIEYNIASKRSSMINKYIDSKSSSYLHIDRILG